MLMAPLEYFPKAHRNSSRLSEIIWSPRRRPRCPDLLGIELSACIGGTRSIRYSPKSSKILQSFRSLAPERGLVDVSTEAEVVKLAPIYALRQVEMSLREFREDSCPKNNRMNWFQQLKLRVR